MHAGHCRRCNEGQDSLQWIWWRQQRLYHSIPGGCGQAARPWLTQLVEAQTGGVVVVLLVLLDVVIARQWTATSSHDLPLGSSDIKHCLMAHKLHIQEGQTAGKETVIDLDHIWMKFCMTRKV